MATITAVAYARYSSDKQQESSITVQLADIRKFCANHGIHLIREYVDEAQTATTDNRKNFQQLVKDVKNGEFKLIVVHRMDRWARNVDDGRYYKKYFAKNGVKVVSAIEGFNESPEGEFYELMSMGMAELFSKKLARESVAGKIANAREGKAHGGKPLLGYKVRDKYYVIEETEAKAVRIIFDMVAQGYGYTYIRDYLNANGYRRADGRLFTNHFYDILRNRKYIGEYVYNRVIGKDDNGSRNNHLNRTECDIIRLQGAVPQIVDTETFYKVQHILDTRKQNRTGTSTRQKRKYLLSGLVRCKECGRAICGNIACAGEKRYAVYRCGGKGKICRTRTINADYLEDYVHSLLADCILAPENALKLEELIQSCYMKAHDELLDKLNEITEVLNKTDAKIQSLEEEQREERSEPIRKLLNEQIDSFVVERNRTEFERSLVEKELSAFPDFKPFTIRKNAKKYAERLKDRSFDNLQRCFKELISVVQINNETIATTINFNALIGAYLPITATVIENRDYVARPENFTKQTLTFSRLTVSIG